MQWRNSYFLLGGIGSKLLWHLFSATESAFLIMKTEIKKHFYSWMVYEMSRCFVWRHLIWHLWQILLLTERRCKAPPGREQPWLLIRWRMWFLKEMQHSKDVSEDHNKGCVQLFKYLFHLLSIIVSPSWVYFPASSDQSIFLINGFFLILVCLPIQITKNEYCW